MLVDRFGRISGRGYISHNIDVNSRHVLGPPGDLTLSRKLEDKFVNHKIELRAFTLNLSLQELHRNRELPGGFICYLGVADSTLPLRGTAHRSVRGAPEMEHEVNMFLAIKSK